jgi:hypothetical protein
MGKHAHGYAIPAESSIERDMSVEKKGQCSTPKAFEQTVSELRDINECLSLFKRSHSQTHRLVRLTLFEGKQTVECF